MLSKEQYFDFVKEASDYFGVDYINIRDTGPDNEPLYIEMKKRIESLEPDERNDRIAICFKVQVWKLQGQPLQVIQVYICQTQATAAGLKTQVFRKKLLI